MAKKSVKKESTKKSKQTQKGLGILSGGIPIMINEKKQPKFRKNA